jgi:Leucine-rich repeat (LRR) protein
MIRNLLKVCCSLIYIVAFHDLSIAQCNHPDDYAALRALYLSSDGDNWKVRDGWPNRNQFLSNPIPPNGTDLDSWFGVLCQNNRVVNILLGNNQLKGTIPQFNLPNLEKFSLFGNDLNGSIPDFNLPALQELSLYQNQLSGPVPTFSKLINLRYLNIAENKLSGNFPDFKLPKLEILEILYNQLSGSLPDFTSMPKLGALNCGNNLLTGSIPDFTNLANLSFFDCRNNSITGPIPNFTNLPNLGTFICAWNQISGTIPNFANIPKLRDFICSFNKISGIIPDFTNIPNLGYFSCQGNFIVGSLPDFSKFSNLYVFDCGRNQITGNIPPFKNLLNLRQIICEYNQFTGAIPKLENLPQLIELDLSNNKLNGSIPIFDLPGLSRLDLGFNQLNGSIPSFIFPKLIELNAENNLLSGSVPTFDTPRLEGLALGYNQLSGPLPELNFQSLRVVLLNNNQFADCIPSVYDRYCDSILIPDSQNPGFFKKVYPIINLSANNELPWKGDFSKYCLTNGSISLQYNAPCDNGIALDGENDTIQNDCTCGNYDCVIQDTVNVCPGLVLWALPSPFVNKIEFDPPGAGFLDTICQCIRISEDFKGYASVFTDLPNFPCFGIRQSTEANFQIDTLIVQPTCGKDNGSLFVQTQGGTPPFNYKWSGGITNNGASNLPSGQYSVTITDSNPSSCPVIKTFTLNPTTAPSITEVITETTCGLANGTINIVITNGQGPYIFNWAGGYTGATISNLAAGNYAVTITDSGSAGCTYEKTYTLKPSEPLSPNITVIQPTCSNTKGRISINSGTSEYQYSWSGGLIGQNPENVLPGSYSVTVTDLISGCTATASVLINSPTALSASATVIQPSCGLKNGGISINTGSLGYQYVWSGGLAGHNPANVGPGTYNVTVTELATSCKDTLEIKLNNSEQLIKSAIVQQPSCEQNNGSIVLSTGPAGYTYNWSGGLIGYNPKDLNPGTYSVTISDIASSCKDTISIELIAEDIDIVTVPDTIFIEQGQTFQINILSNDTYPMDSFTLRLEELPAEFIQLVSFDQSGTLRVEPVNQFQEDLTASYVVCNKCGDCVDGTLYFIDARLKEIIQVNVITPNESANNTLRFSRDYIPGMMLRIFNRWGQQIYFSSDYNNDWDASGHAGGVYYYVLEVYGVTLKKTLTVLK